MASHVEVTGEDFAACLAELRDRYPALKEDDLFLLWFLRAYVTESEQKAAEAVAGGSKDKNVDAVFLDHDARAVIVVQGKYHKSLGKHTEKREAVIALSEVAVRLCECSEDAFAKFLKTTEPLVAARLTEARLHVINHKYRVWLYFVTLGNVTESTREDAESLASKADCDARLEVIDAHRAKTLLRDYLDGVAPPIPVLDLEMEYEEHVKVNSIAQRYDKKNKIESWVFSMRGDEVAALFNYGVRLFARNIRGFLGANTPINEGMVKTLETEPDRFFYYNNGVTILCDEAEKKSREGRDILRVRNPQVINGQQTTRTLHNNKALAAKASVIVKVIRVEHRMDNLVQFDELLSRIVTGTNWQNKIRASDLISNERKQIDLERSLRKIGYAYIRKRQTKGEARKAAGGKQWFFVKKEEFAQAVAACDLDPVVARTKSEKLFEEEYYNDVFPNAEPYYYLARYWLLRNVAYFTSGVTKYKETRWMVLHHLWKALSPHVASASGARTFVGECEKRGSCVFDVPLNRAVEQAAKAVYAFYLKNRGDSDEAIDIQTFFKSKRANPSAFAAYWKQAKERPIFEKHFAKVIAGIKA